MNRVLASFTTSERNIIVFVLLTVAAGYALLEWRGEQETSMTFSASPAAAGERELSPQDVLPNGMSSDGKIDINVADKQLLETLPGIGPSLAARLMQHREANGPFTSMEDVDAVPGIGPAMMAKLAPLVAFGGAEKVEPVAPATAGMPNVAAHGAVATNLWPGNASAPATAVIPPGRSNPAGGIVNINAAGVTELDTLKGVGPALAQRIIQERQRAPFRTVEEITRVRGIGSKILQDNWSRLSVH